LGMDVRCGVDHVSPPSTLTLAYATPFLVLKCCSSARVLGLSLPGCVRLVIHGSYYMDHSTTGCPIVVLTAK
jgi:hypothetical protein